MSYNCNAWIVLAEFYKKNIQKTFFCHTMEMASVFIIKQVTRKRCIKKAYFVKPFVKTTEGLLIRNNSNSRQNRKIIPLYDTEYLNHVRDIYEFIDKSQLSTDYGGTMQYNHIAWVDFQRVRTIY
jgi:hypothetical protein